MKGLRHSVHRCFCIASLKTELGQEEEELEARMLGAGEAA